ncbi:hypothetical protein QPK87_15165 [Kamptonema cortianum]|nr:hypothetical protein [Oscillatoria laete-virens]MDK3157902.1 hypothetical protein [Kamptonema cortianum]MDL5046032.1 hypothetical protein [Oscillatoria amoena NRMC-F 0135]MDL5052740.1 hypothetical protein [Oscillatoria laete-virens NRMC-F 0139]
MNDRIHYVLAVLFFLGLSTSSFLNAEEAMYPKTASPQNGYMLATLDVRQNHPRMPKSLQEKERVVLVDKNRQIIAVGPPSSKYHFIVWDYYGIAPTGFWNESENTMVLENTARTWSRVDFFRHCNGRLEEITRSEFPLSQHIPDFIAHTRYSETFEKWIDEKTCEIKLSGIAQTGKNYRGEQDDQKCDYPSFEGKVVIDLSGANAEIVSMSVNLNP